MSELFKLLGTISVKNEDANAAIDTTIQKANDLNSALSGTSGNASAASESIDGVGKSADEATAKMEKTATTSIFWGNMMANAATKAGSFFVNSIKQGNEYNMQIEKTTAAFIAAYDGDVAKAEALVNKLVQYDKNTPYNLNGVMTAASVLRLYGVPLNDIPEMIKMLGEVAGGDANNLYGLARTYGEINTKGMLYADDFRSLTTWGFDIGTALKASQGWSPEEFAKNKNQGLITAEMAKEALIYATSPEGAYYGQMERIMASSYGKKEKFDSDWTMFQGKVAEPVTEALGDLYPVLSDIVGFLGDHAPETRLGMSVVGAGGAYATAKSFFPSLKGVKLPQFLGKHPLLSVLGSAGLFAMYADQKIAEMDKKSGFISGFEEIAGLGDGEYSGMFGELSEIPEDIAYYNRTKNNMTAAEKRNLLSAALGYYPLIPDTWRNVEGRQTVPVDVSTDFITGLTTHIEKIINSDSVTGWTPAGNAGQTVDVSGLSAQLGTMIGLLAQILANSTKPIVLNTGALVGGILPSINSGLGKIVNQERG